MKYIVSKYLLGYRGFSGFILIILNFWRVRKNLVGKKLQTWYNDFAFRVGNYVGIADVSKKDWQTLNVNNLLSTWTPLESISNFLLKTFLRQCLLLPFSWYCCSKVGRYYHLPSRVHGAKGLKFQWKPPKIFFFDFVKSIQYRENWKTRFLICQQFHKL